MRKPTLSLIVPACASMLALALSACGGSQPSALPGAGGMVQNAANSPLKTSSPGPLKASPKKLNFSTALTMKLTVSESNYTGKFKISISPKHLIGISSKSPKGPNAKLTVTAQHAGSGKISVSDDHGGTKNVPFTVTQGVIIIQ
jgi:hypothetical protein